jgi:hypothetical protein
MYIIMKVKLARERSILADGHIPIGQINVRSHLKNGLTLVINLIIRTSKKAELLNYTKTN